MAERDHIGDFNLGSHTAHVTRSLGEINFDNLKGEVTDAGGHAVWWGTLAAQAQALADRAKLRLEVTRAEVGQTLRREHGRVGDKFTVDSISDEVMLSGPYREAREAQITAEESAAVVRAVSMAINQKQRTLTDLSMYVARELGGDPLGGARRAILQADRAAVKPTKSSRTPVV